MGPLRLLRRFATEWMKNLKGIPHSVQLLGFLRTVQENTLKRTDLGRSRLVSLGFGFFLKCFRRHASKDFFIFLSQFRFPVILDFPQLSTITVCLYTLTALIFVMLELPVMKALPVGLKATQMETYSFCPLFWLREMISEQFYQLKLFRQGNEISHFCSNHFRLKKNEFRKTTSMFKWKKKWSKRSYLREFEQRQQYKGKDWFAEILIRLNKLLFCFQKNVRGKRIKNPHKGYTFYRPETFSSSGNVTHSRVPGGVANTMSTTWAICKLPYLNWRFLRRLLDLLLQLS